MSAKKTLESCLSSRKKVQDFLKSSASKVQQICSGKFESSLRRITFQGLAKLDSDVVCSSLEVIKYLAKQNHSQGIYLLLQTGLHGILDKILQRCFEVFDDPEFDVEKVLGLFMDDIVIIVTLDGDQRKFFKTLIIPLLKMVQKSYIQVSFCEMIVESLIQILTTFDREDVFALRNVVRESNDALNICKDLTLRLHLVGDYSLQASILELIFRVVPSNTRSSVSLNWNKNPKLAQLFSDITYQLFDETVRAYLNQVNKDSSEFGVLSLPASLVRVAGYVFTNRCWIDLCFRSRKVCISFTSLDDEESQESLTKDMVKDILIEESNDVITVKIATKIPLKLALDDDVTEQNCDVLMFAIERSHVHNVTSFNNSLTSILQPSELGVKQSRPRASDAECANLLVQSNSNIDGFSQDVLLSSQAWTWKESKPETALLLPIVERQIKDCEQISGKKLELQRIKQVGSEARRHRRKKSENVVRSSIPRDNFPSIDTETSIKSLEVAEEPAAVVEETQEIVAETQVSNQSSPSTNLQLSQLGDIRHVSVTSSRKRKPSRIQRADKERPIITSSTKQQEDAKRCSVPSSTKKQKENAERFTVTSSKKQREDTERCIVTSSKKQREDTERSTVTLSKTQKENAEKSTVTSLKKQREDTERSIVMSSKKQVENTKKPAVSSSKKRLEDTKRRFDTSSKKRRECTKRPTITSSSKKRRECTKRSTVTSSRKRREYTERRAVTSAKTQRAEPTSKKSASLRRRDGISAVDAAACIMRDPETDKPPQPPPLESLPFSSQREPHGYAESAPPLPSDLPQTIKSDQIMNRFGDSSTAHAHISSCSSEQRKSDDKNKQDADSSNKKLRFFADPYQFEDKQSVAGDSKTKPKRGRGKKIFESIGYSSATSNTSELSWVRAHKKLRNKKPVKTYQCKPIRSDPVRSDVSMLSASIGQTSPESFRDAEEVELPAVISQLDNKNASSQSVQESAPESISDTKSIKSSLVIEPWPVQVPLSCISPKYAYPKLVSPKYASPTQVESIQSGEKMKESVLRVRNNATPLVAPALPGSVKKHRSCKQPKTSRGFAKPKQLNFLQHREISPAQSSQTKDYVTSLRRNMEEVEKAWKIFTLERNDNLEGFVEKLMKSAQKHEVLMRKIRTAEKKSVEQMKGNQATFEEFLEESKSLFTTINRAHVEYSNEQEKKEENFDVVLGELSLQVTEDLNKLMRS